MGRARDDVSHAAISGALAELGERSGGAEVAAALRCPWESFEAQMRRRMRCRPRAHREAYRRLARAGAEKVRFHLEATGAIPAEGPRRRAPGVAIRARGRGRRTRARRPRHAVGSRPRRGDR